MSSTLLFWPILLQVILTISIYVRLLVVKRRAFAAKEVDRKRVSVDPFAWPDSVIVVNNNLINQFQVPVLFYVVSIVLVQLDAADPLSVGAAWIFALSRLAHAYVHLGSNHVPYRMRLCSLGLWMVLAMSLSAGLSLLGSHPPPQRVLCIWTASPPEGATACRQVTFPPSLPDT